MLKYVSRELFQGLTTLSKIGTVPTCKCTLDLSDGRIDASVRRYNDASTGQHVDMSMCQRVATSMRRRVNLSMC